MIKDRDGNLTTSEESVLRRWNEYFEELLNKENDKECRNEEPEKIRKRVEQISKKMKLKKKALKRMKTGKSVGPNDISVKV